TFATNSELNVARFTEIHVAHTIVEARCLELKDELSNLRDKSHNDTPDELINRFSNLEHYKESYDSIKITRVKHIEQVTALTTENVNLKAKILDTVNSVSKDQIIIFIVDSGCSKHMTGNLKLLTNFVEKFLGTVKFENDQIAPILGYGDLVQGLVTIKWVYYVEGLNHNLFSVGQFCDADLEVAFRKSTCYIHDLKGNDLLTATSSQAWLWHRRLSHLNFDTNNLLSNNDIVIGLPKVKICQRSSLFFLSKDETPKVLIDFLRLVQRGLHAQVRIVRTDKCMKFLNKTLHAYFTAEGIQHQTSIARTPE
nr:hypothetical protein [Tanacetum cinerariifolium]